MLAEEVRPEFGPEYIMLVRNPYRRLESFFKEKLRQRLDGVRRKSIYTEELSADLPSVLKIDPSDSLENKVSGLAQT
jgi:hypothetical protein